MASTFQRAELADLLSAAIGDEKAHDVIIEAARTLGLDETMFNRAQVLGVLETIASTPGLVGITARFAKTRVYLKWPK